MARNDVEVHRVSTIFNEVEQLHDAINRRAYDLFQERGDLRAGALADWFDAERQLVWKPAIELRQKDNQIEVLAATPGVEPKDLDVEITPEDVLIKAEVDHRHTPEEGAVQVCEFNRGHLFRSIHLPEQIDPDSATAEYRNGMLRVTAEIAKPAGRKVEIAVS